MPREVTIVFPHQLYQSNPAISIEREVIMVEEWLYFNQYNFNKQKLILHRATMQFYKDYLVEKKFNVTYVEANDVKSNVSNLIAWLLSKNVQVVHYIDTVDNRLERRLTDAAARHLIRLQKYASPNFLNQLSDVESFFNNRKTYFQTDFYKWQRKQRKILLQANGEPEGGKWSFDEDNRKPVKRSETIPELSFSKENTYVAEARQYVQKHYPNNYGSDAPLGNRANAFFATTFEEADAWLEEFLEKRFEKFGVYEDAIVAEQHYLFHSVLTHILNIGLLNPAEIIGKALTAAAKFNVPLNSVEGFIRQIIGWREFIRIVYEREGSRQRTKNFWGFTRKVPKSFWEGTTGILPVDNVISKVLKTGYSHHIERLMVMGNFMLLCEFDPDEVYRWFMELYIDAYDWVMVPNTYGMTQFADGGLMTTKPYISGSNYLMKMSNYPKGEWQKIWDGLFWRFMHVHRDFLRKNMRLGMLIKTFDKMPEEKQLLHLQHAENFLSKLDNPAT
ncbi:MAG: cryptochrome/photolyase family protein [Chitinophagaceae bacterium]|nr:cryptochrome/photolyase family protein [Chitinophagaceae bacterium]